jgi:hypothetical protein
VEIAAWPVLPPDPAVVLLSLQRLGRFQTEV